MVILANMRNGVILGGGKGNADLNYSALHDFGRNFKRKDVTNQYTVSHFAEVQTAVSK